MVLNVIMYICTCIMPILVYCGIKLNRGNHSGPIKERGTQTPQQDIEPTEQREPSSSLATKMMMEYSVKEERYFQHFKGGKYKFIHSAFDSETLERMVVYQALYGEMAYWVRPEKMFFGKVTRDGRTFNRFTEIDK